MFTELREQLAAKQFVDKVWRRQKQFVDTSMAATEIKNDDINKRGRKMIRVGIIGATGYAGGELVRILLNHKDAKIVWYGSRSYIDKKYYQVYQNMFQLVEDICKDDNLEELAKQVDVIFTATPQGFLAGLLTEEILSQVRSWICLLITGSRMWPPMKNGTASSTNLLSSLRKQYTDSARSIVTRSRRRPDW